MRIWKTVALVSISSVLAVSSLIVPSLCMAQGKVEKPLTKEQLEAVQLRSIKQASVPGMKLLTTIPTNFPVPVYPSNVTRKAFAHSTKGQPTATASIQTGDAPDVVYRWYLDQAKKAGLSTKVPSEKMRALLPKNPDMYFFTAENSKQMLNFTVSKSHTEPGSDVSIQWALK